MKQKGGKNCTINQQIKVIIQARKTLKPSLGEVEGKIKLYQIKHKLSGFRGNLKCKKIYRERRKIMSLM